MNETLRSRCHRPNADNAGSKQQGCAAGPAGAARWQRRLKSLPQPHRVRHVLSAGLLLLGLLFAACAGDPEPAAVVTGGPITAQAVRVRRGDIAEVLTVTGETAARTVLRLASPVAGVLTFLTVRAGDRVDRGVVVARVMPLENQAALHGFTILEQPGMLTRQEHQRAERLRGRLRKNDIALRVPFAAVVATRLRNPGEQVGRTDVILEVFDPDSLYVLAHVPLESAGRLRAGMPVEIRGAASHATGKIEALVTAVRQQALTVPVRIALASPFIPPLLHAAVRCRIAVAQHTGALWIPRTALLSSAVAQRGVVMVAANHRAHRRAVTLGLRSEDALEVTSGLRLGEAVLVAGQFGLPDGAVVSLVPAGDTHAP
ncbi:MAG: efflux RND transporter periplasmic adaptor subunit [Candidatus Binatia bacterium]